MAQTEYRDAPSLPDSPRGGGTRLIVELCSPPLMLAQAPSSDRPSVVSQQERLTDLVQRELPTARIEGRTRAALNALIVRLDLTGGLDVATLISRLAALDGVAAVYQETEFTPSLYASVPLVGASEAWDWVGGEDDAGAGVRVAVIDAGIDEDHPMLAGEGLSYPPGYPLGDTRYTSPKVIAARAYFRPSDPPVEGEDTPVPGANGSSHGLQVASVIAGERTTANYRGAAVSLVGVAPRAHLMNYRVFYPAQSGRNSAYSIEIVQAIDDAVADGAQVLCLPWNSVMPLPESSSAVAAAVRNAIAAGCVVVGAAGNQGPGYGSATGIPGGMEGVITVGAASKSQVLGWNLLDVHSYDAVPESLTAQVYEPALFGEAFDLPIGPIRWADAANTSALDTPPLACEPITSTHLSGLAGLAARGECYFSDKAYHIQNAGGALALVYNDSDELEAMGCAGDYCDPGVIDLPVAMLRASTGEALRNRLTTHPTDTVRLDPAARVISTNAGVIAASSARGPAYAARSKPDLVAPGVSVLVASDHGDVPLTRYEQVSGTSLACAHVAGLAALFLQRYPDWSPAEVKSALMACTDDEGLALAGDPSTEAGVLARGAGMVDASLWADRRVVCTPPSLSITGLTAGAQRLAQVTVHDRRIVGQRLPYLVETTAISGSGIVLSATPEVALAPGEAATLDVSVQVLPDASLGDHEATLSFGAAGERGSLPIWLYVEPLADGGPDVLVIDNDFSMFGSYQDHCADVTDALDALGIDHDLWNADARYQSLQTVPDLDELLSYRAVVWVTGDNRQPDGYYVISTPLTRIDTQILARYLDSGGTLLALGQNLAEASDVNADPDAQWGRADLYHGYLGAHWVQGNVFGAEDEASPPQDGPALVGIPTSFLAGISLHMGPVGDGAGNQVSIDEIAPGGDPERSDAALVTPLLVAVGGDPADNGYTALAKGDEPTLEDQTGDLPYRTVYMSFGLEGINTWPGTSGRAALLERALDWLLDEVSLTVPDVVGAPNELMTLTCSAKSSRGYPVSGYRWQVSDGDSQRIYQTPSPTLAVTYDAHGVHELVVEATDTLGHRAVASGTVTIVTGGHSRLHTDNTTVAAGAEIRYTVRAENSGSQTVAMSFALDVPSQCQYVSHLGGEYASGTLTWSDQLPPQASYTCELVVRTDEMLTTGTPITATAQFTAGDDAFSQSVTSRIMGVLALPLILALASD